MEGEKLTFGHPGLLGMKRKDATSSLEGDYIDTGIYDGRDNLIGWIEISGTSHGKMPSANTIRWIEVIATVLGLLLTVRGYAGGNGKC
ncbi:MAG: hypothetical protein JW880_04225 [Candidatus Thermoplasmatota archaeon]|nr:hypothetical protein [Candidatus Thermoplasmatota archaeon]